jgi:hypothetical protein
MTTSRFPFSLSGLTTAVRAALGVVVTSTVTLLTPQGAFAQAAADPATVVEQTRIRATGQASSIDASAATGNQTGAGGSVGYGPLSLRGNYSSSSSAGLTRVRTGGVYIDSATVRGSQVEATGTLSNARVQNATVDTGVASIGKNANN